MICPVCIAAPMAMGGAYMSIFKNKYFWLGIIIMIIALIVYYKNKDCVTCKRKPIKRN